MEKAERKKQIKEWSELKDFDPNKMRFCCGCLISITEQNKDIYQCPTHGNSDGLRLYPSSRSIIQTLSNISNKCNIKEILQIHVNTITDYNDTEVSCTYCKETPMIVYYDKKSNTACCKLCKEEIIELIKKNEQKNK